MVNPEGFLEKEVNSELDFGRKAEHAGNRKTSFGKRIEINQFSSIQLSTNDNYTLPL